MQCDKNVFDIQMQTKNLIFHAQVKRKNVQPALMLMVRINTQGWCRINQTVFKQKLST